MNVFLIHIIGGGGAHGVMVIAMDYRLIVSEGGVLMV